MCLDMISVANKLFICGATPVLVRHITRLKPKMVRLIQDQNGSVRSDQEHGTLDNFLASYGAFDNVTIDVTRFLEAVEASHAQPDLAFQGLRAAMMEKAVDRGRRPN